VIAAYFCHLEHELIAKSYFAIHLRNALGIQFNLQDHCSLVSSTLLHLLMIEDHLDRKEYYLKLVYLHSVIRVELIIKIMELNFIAAIVVEQLIIR